MVGLAFVLHLDEEEAAGGGGWAGDAAIARGEEVFVVRYEKGVAYVRRWEDLPDLQEM